MQPGSLSQQQGHGLACWHKGPSTSDCGYLMAAAKRQLMLPSGFLVKTQSRGNSQPRCSWSGSASSIM
jgi:hypothetical protein